MKEIWVKIYCFCYSRHEKSISFFWKSDKMRGHFMFSEHLLIRNAKHPILVIVKHCLLNGLKYKSNLG